MAQRQKNLMAFFSRQGAQPAKKLPQRKLSEGHATPEHAQGRKRGADEAQLSDHLEPHSVGPSQTTCKKRKMQRVLGDGESSKAEAYKEVETRFAWLTDGQLRDAKGRSQRAAAFDSRTFTVPQAVFNRLSDSQKQYWQVKSMYRDVIIFFKVGSFYELYEDDAQIGQDVLNWKMTITGVGHCRQVGCPESGIEEAVARLTAAGYKVGRMEQMETAAQAKAKRGPKAVIQRRLTRIHTPATATGAGLAADAVHLMALCECGSETRGLVSQQQQVQYGFAFLDAAAGRIYVGAQTDDAGRLNLTALLSQVAPKEVLCARGSFSSATQRRLSLPPVPLQVSAVDPVSEFPLPEGAVDKLNTLGCFGGCQNLAQEVVEAGPAALAALVGLVLHLQRMKAATELVSAAAVVPYALYQAALRLDGPTLANLELLQNSDGGPRGSLLARLDSCASPGGRRLLRSWICRPLQDVAAINARLDAVYEMRARPGLASFRVELQRMGDLERALGRVRAAAAPVSAGLPTYLIQAAQNRRLAAVASAVQAIRDGMAALVVLGRGGDEADGPPRSMLLLEAVGASPWENKLAMDAFEDTEQALLWRSPPAKQGSASKGRKVAAASPAVGLQERVVASHLRPKMTPEEQVEVEIAVTTALIARFIDHIAAWEALAAALNSLDVMTAFAAFGAEADTCRPEFLQKGGSGAVLELRGLWHPCAVAPPGGCIIANDVVLGAAPSSSHADTASSPHAADDITLSSMPSFPRDNDVVHGAAPSSSPQARALLLTGPNMGGKSTLLRATCIAVVLAQMGCPVPAASCRLTPVDCIFTRLGASDRIMAGESTFMVECTETASILQHATPDSLVVLDELGRGTSTFDGYAIAYAVLRHLSSAFGCRLMFATHYHPLTREFAGSPAVALGHMAAIVPGAEAQGGQQRSMSGIVFLYQLRPGACPRSYGLQVAGLAGIPPAVVAIAERAGSVIEARLEAAFRGTMSSACSRGTLSQAERLALRQAAALDNKHCSVKLDDLVAAWQGARSAIIGRA